MGCAVAEALSILCGSPSRSTARRQRIDRLVQWSPWPLMPGDRTHAMILATQSILLSRCSVDDFSTVLRSRLTWYRRSHPLASSTEWFHQSMRRTRHNVLRAGKGRDPIARAAIMSVILQGHSHSGVRWIHRSTLITHRNALVANTSLLVAIASQCAQVYGTRFAIAPDQVLPMLMESTAVVALKDRLEMLDRFLRQGRSLMRAARGLGYRNGLKNNLVDAPLLAVFAWLRYGDNYRECMERIVRLGGETSSAATLAGALIGTQYGVAAIPAEWRERTTMEPYGADWIEAYVDRLRDWPHGPEDIQRTATLPAMPIRQLARNIRFSLWQGTLPLFRWLARDRTPWTRPSR